MEEVGKPEDEPVAVLGSMTEVSVDSKAVDELKTERTNSVSFKSLLDSGMTYWSFQDWRK